MPENAILAAFLGRAGHIFGLPTAGVPIAPSFDEMPDGARLLVAAARIQDRPRPLNDASVHPDQLVLALPGATGDAALDADSDWLLDQPGCNNA